MDKLLGGNKKQGTTGQTGASTQAAGGQQDYADKGLESLEKKQGMSLGRDTNERITDAAREGFEKVTGKHVPAKFSN